jgi:hypothetical protein
MTDPSNEADFPTVMVVQASSSVCAVRHSDRSRKMKIVMDVCFMIPP